MGYTSEVNHRRGAWGLVGWLVDFLTSSSKTRLYRRRLTSDNVMCCHTRDSGEAMTSISAGPTSRQRAATAGIEPGTSSPEVARSTELPRPPGVGLNLSFEGR